MVLYLSVDLQTKKDFCLWQKTKMPTETLTFVCVCEGKKMDHFGRKTCG